MDTETVLKVIAMLEARIDTIKLNQPVPSLHDWHKGQINGLETFKEHLDKCIEAQVNQVENDMNRGD